MRSRHLSLGFVPLLVMLFLVAQPAQAQPDNDPTIPGIVEDPTQQQSLNCIDGAGDGLVLDDGTVETGRGNTVTPLVTLFTIPSDNFGIEQVCICLTGQGGVTDATFDIVFFDDTGAGGQPGAEVGRVGPNAVTGIGQFSDFTWYDIALSQTVNSGPLYIGIDFADPTNRFVCGDDSLSFNQTNWYFSSLWNPDDLMDYLIRAEGLIVPVELESFEIEK